MRPQKKKKPKVIGGRGRCPFCKENWEPTWRDPEKVESFLSPWLRISSRAYTKICAKHQRRYAEVVKQLRHLGLLPFVGGKED